VEEERASDPILLSNIDVSNCGPHGGHYTASEYKSMVSAAGFKDVHHIAPVITRGTKQF
jgi:hypothetical protein